MKMAIFEVDRRWYGMDISFIREISRMREITPVPETEKYMEGVITREEKAIPVFNLAKKFGNINTTSSANKSNRIILTENDNKLTAFLVDKVIDIINIKEPEIIKIDQEFNETECFNDGLKINDKFILLINSKKLLENIRTHKNIEVYSPTIPIKTEEKSKNMEKTKHGE
ncbi:CheW-like protein domain protein [Candidatus Omnitrophus magneticus]|uniref:CheW-like protein domain protein n=1 Tax=Candidatus Omnitrophus magneticus TaxID=1609969 RepID=A0A0F0CUY1_9BACT|nr:CheW-like protein domain protein [Candidatus Omnitrophus magneticus]